MTPLLLSNLLQRRRQQLRALTNRRNQGEVLRFGALLFFTLLLPALLLAGLALSSIQGEELRVDAEYRLSAGSMAAQLATRHREIFQRFERAAKDRLERGLSPLEELDQLSPHLRAVIRLNEQGLPEMPLRQEPRSNVVPPPQKYELALQSAARQEAQGSHLAALQTYGTLLDELSLGESNPLLQAQASLGLARSGWRARQIDLARDKAIQLRRQPWADLRDSEGHRFGDLAEFLLARMLLEQDPAEGARALAELVDQLLDSAWALEHGGEPAIAARALSILGDRAPKSWLDRAQRRLTERRSGWTWANQLTVELDLLSVATPEEEFQYLGARPDSPAFWALVSAQGETAYAFSFSVTTVIDELSRAAGQLTLVDERLNIQLQPATLSPPAQALATRNLGPQLPNVQLVVLPADPAALDRLKVQSRWNRRLVIGVALSMILLGALLTARIVAREVESARLKADFAASVSHELRSPITQIRLKAEALQLGLVDEEDDRLRHYLAITNEAERLSRLVDNVLDFAAIERGVKSYQLRPDDLLEVVWQTAESMRDAIEERGCALEVDLPDDLPTVRFDRDAIKQVLVNLLSNAQKYGAEGGWIGVRVRPGLDAVDVSVSDRGQGIAPDELEKVFDEFYRSAAASVRSKKGTGIGLSIVRYIVEAHHGVITVDSQPGRGATFTFTLPLTDPTDVMG